MVLTECQALFYARNVYYSYDSYNNLSGKYYDYCPTLQMKELERRG